MQQNCVGVVWKILRSSYVILTTCFTKCFNYPTHQTGLLVHRRVRSVQRGQSSQSLRSRLAFSLRWVVARRQRQARASSIRPREDGRSDLPRSGISADLLRCRKLRRCQGAFPQVGVDHVATLRSSLQSTHWARWNSRLSRQVGNACRSAQHGDAALDQCNREVEEAAVLNRMQIHPVDLFKSKIIVYSSVDFTIIRQQWNQF